MPSATIKRHTGTMSNSVRTTQFGDFTSTIPRANADENLPQSSTLGSRFGGNIWANTIGSGLFNGKREVPRSHDDDDEIYDGRSGSGALAASSEADHTWTTRVSGPWNVDKTSPTTLSTSQSGSTSPIRHRGSNTSVPSMTFTESQQTSPYLTTSRPAIGQGPGMPTRAQNKSGLDPSSGPFKYPHTNGQGYVLYSDDKENKLYHRDSFDMDGSNPYNNDPRVTPGSGVRSVQAATPRDGSLPPSRQSDTGPIGTTSSFFGNGYAGFGHNASNSLQLQRPSVSGKTSAMPTFQNGRNFPGHVQELEMALSTMQVNDKQGHNQYMESGGPELAQAQNNQQQQQQPYDAQLPSNGPATVWGGSKGTASYLSEPYTGSFSNQLNFKQSRMTERESEPAGTNFRNVNSSKYYSDDGSPAVDFERSYGPRSQGTSDFERNFSRQQFTPQHQQFLQTQMLYPGQFQAQFLPQPYDFSPHQQPNDRAGPGQFGFQVPLAPYATTLSAPRGPARDQDIGHGVRSALLEDFRSNTKTNKRYEIKDIYNHVVEFSGDQHGSRFIQQKLECANSDEKDQIFREIQPNALQLMADVFGNYVIQKLFEHGSQIQKRVLGEQMRNHVQELSVQMYGCRVVQKALEHVLADQQAELVKELQPGVLTCVKDQNGNHVIQKAIERVPTEHIRFIIDAFKGQVHVLATHPYGCRVIQRMLEYCTEQDQAAVLEELFACASMLITDQYGNYVTQHVIAHGKPEDRDRLIKIVTAQLLTLSKHKFASNVVEKSIQCGTDEQRRAIVAQITALHSDGSSPLQLMMKDQYGNYVIQKLLGILKGSEREHLIEEIKPQLLALKKFNFGKQIAAIEKLIYTGAQAARPQFTPTLDQQSRSVQGPRSSAASTAPIETASSSATPMLTTEQNSPESSSVASTNADAFEVTTVVTTAKNDSDDLPEVTIQQS